MSALYALMIGRGFLVYELTGSASYVGLVTGASAAPSLIVGLLGGAVADRVDRGIVIQVGQLLVAIGAFIVALLTATGLVNWVHLLAIAIVHGASSSFMWPARQSMIAEIVDRDRLPNAMALSSAASSSTSLIAPAIAGLLYAVVGPEGVFFMVCALSLLAVLLTSRVSHRRPTRFTRHAGMLGDIKEGLVYVGNQKLLLTLLIVAMSSFMLVQPFTYLMPVFVGDIYDRHADAYGLLISMTGLGALAGSLAFAANGGRNRGVLLFVGGLVAGTAVTLVGLVPLYYYGLGFMVLMGIGDSGRRVVVQSLLVERSEDRFRGRVISLYMAVQGVAPLAIVAGGVAIDRFGGQAMAIVMGAVMLLVTVVTMVTQKEIRSAQ